MISIPQVIFQHAGILNILYLCTDSQGEVLFHVMHELISLMPMWYQCSITGSRNSALMFFHGMDTRKLREGHMSVWCNVIVCLQKGKSDQNSEEWQWNLSQETEHCPISVSQRWKRNMNSFKGKVGTSEYSSISYSCIRADFWYLSPLNCEQ